MTVSPVVGIVLDIDGTKIELGPVSTAEIEQEGLELTWPSATDKQTGPVALGTATDLASALAKLAPGIATVDPSSWPAPFDTLANWVASLELSLVRAHLHLLPPTTSVTISGTSATPFDGSGDVQLKNKDTSDTTTYTVTVVPKQVFPKDQEVAAIGTTTAASPVLPKGATLQVAANTDLTVTAGGTEWTLVLQLGKADQTDLGSIGNFGIEALLLGATNEPPKDST